MKLVQNSAPIDSRNLFDDQLYDFLGTNCNSNKGFSTSTSALLRNQVTTEIESLLQCNE